MIDKVILIILALGFFACCSSYYQAHCMSEETSRNITAIITAPPGSVINSVSVTPLIPGVNEINFTGTWTITTNPKSVPTHDITGIPTITFDGFMHNVCCWNHKEEQVYLQPFTAYVGHRAFKGYGNLTYFLLVLIALTHCNYARIVLTAFQPSTGVIGIDNCTYLLYETLR